MYDYDYYISDDLPFGFGIDGDGNYGYIKVGADTVTPFTSQADVDAAYESGKAELTELVTYIKSLDKLPLQRQEFCTGSGLNPTGYYSYNTTYTTYWTGSCPVCGSGHTSNRDWRSNGMPSHTRTVTYDYSYTVTDSILDNYL